MLVMPKVGALGRRVAARLREGGHDFARLGRGQGAYGMEHGRAHERAAHKAMKAWVALFTNARVFHLDRQRCPGCAVHMFWTPLWNGQGTSLTRCHHMGIRSGS
jgi:hypothetical protein